MSNPNLSESFGTLSETVNGLVREGYTHDFNVQGECIICHQANISLAPEEFQIDKVYRFEGVSDPDDESIVYAISSPKFGVKGVLVNGYGVSADSISAELVEKLQTVNPQVVTVVSSTDSTLKRPEGERELNPPMVELSLDKFIAQIKSESAWAEGKQNAITIFKSHSMRIVLIGLPNGVEMKSHKASGVISVQVIEGRVDFVTEHQTALIEKGQMIALQENITHSVLALADSFFLLTLSMVR
jgi:quercetin dioxygenase-like cupin family protein